MKAPGGLHQDTSGPHPAARPGPDPLAGSPPHRLVLGALLIFGLAARVWMLAGPLGALDSDEAVIGLMARHLLHGQVSTFFWGQSYGGPHEAALAAGLFAVFGSSTLALKLVPVILSAVAAVLTWRIGRLLFGEAAGRWAGALFWAWPAAFVWWSTKASVYWGSLSLALAVLLLLCRLDRRARAGTRLALRDLAEIGSMGLATGLAWWANPQTLYILAPAYVWFSPRLLRRWKALPVLAAGVLAGAAPWIRYNLIHDWASLEFTPQPLVAGGYWGRMWAFLHVALPMALGVRIPYTRAWVLGAVGIAALVAILALFAAWAVRSGLPGRSAAPALGLTALAYPLLFAYSPFSWYVDHPRYLLFLAPTVAILLGHGLSRRRAWIPGTAVAVALTVAGLVAMSSSRQFEPNAPDVHLPASLAPLHRLLAGNDVHDAFGDYWLAYRTTFESGERVTVSPTYVVRNPAIDAAVRATPAPAYIFVKASRSYALFQAACAGLGVPLAIHESGPFALAQPQRRLLPEQVASVWQPQP